MSKINKASTTEKNIASSPTANGKTRKVPMMLKILRIAFGIGGHLAPNFVGRKAYQLWFTPTRFKTPASERAALESAENEHHEINGYSIATYSWGQSDRTVLLVHGWSGRGTQLGPFVQPLLEAGYRVLSFDAPAHGKSSGKQTNIYEVSDVILALQKHYGKFDSVITHSFGGPCIAVALRSGLEASRIISISPPATTKGLVEKFIHILNIPAKAENALMHRIEETFGENIWHDISMKNTVKELKIPAMIIHDDQDEDIPWQEGHVVSQAWNNAKFIKTSGLGHRRILKDPAVIESTINFITVAA